MKRKSCFRLLIISGILLFLTGCAGFEARAAAKGDLDVLRDYLAGGGGTDDLQRGDRTFLMYAAKGGEISVLDYLIKEGASLSLGDKKGRTALMYGAAAGKKEAVDILIEAGEGEDLNAADREGRTALMLASERDRSSVVESLLSAKADFKIKDSKGWTALLLALDDSAESSYGIKRSVTLLTEAGARFDGTSSIIRDIASKAYEKGNRELLNYLYSRGLDKTLRIHGRFHFQFNFFL
jgi:hypothetical protein